MTSVAPGSYYLSGVDHLERRTYARALHSAAVPTAQLAYTRTVAAARPVPRALTMAAPMLRVARRICRA